MVAKTTVARTQRLKRCIGRIGAVSLGTVSLGALSGCSLDFDKFEEFTEPPAPIIDMAPIEADMPDVGDMFVGRDMEPEPAEMGMDDGDMDGVADDVDNCPMVANPDQADGDMDGQGDACDTDADNDMIEDAVDNCPMVPNPDQYDLDRDGQGDACDPDPDGDGLDDAAEQAKGTDRLRADTDADGVLDGEDTCPLQADRVGADTDADGAGDACDIDDDGDGILDWADNCVATANPGQGEECAGDIDGDGVADGDDTCPYVLNPDQAIQPCQSRFEAVTYLRDAHDVLVGAGGVQVATAGGLLAIDDEGYTVIGNVEGLAGNRVRAVTTDGDGRRWLTTDGGVVVIRPDGMIISMRATDAGGGPQGALRDVVMDAEGAIWVSSDAGINRLDAQGWSLITAGLPSLDVRGLYADEIGRVWAATALGVVRITGGAAEQPLGGLPAVGGFNRVVPAGANVWLLADQGAVLLDGADQVVGTYAGIDARDVAPSPSGAYLATGAGVQRIDADGRLFPPGAALLPSPDVRSAGGTAEGPRWLATANGVLAIDGYFASFSPEQLPGCVTVATRVADALWIGTQDGLYRMLADGSNVRVEAGLPGQNIYAIRRIGNVVWVATDLGVGVLGLDGSAVREIGAADGIPAGTIVDVVEGVNGQVWVGSAENGIARSDAAGQNWTTYLAPDVLVAGNQCRGLAHDSTNLWAATTEGLTYYADDNRQEFLPPIDNGGGRLPARSVQDVHALGTRVFAATQRGVGQRGPDERWTTLRRSTGGLPAQVGTDSVRTLYYDGTYVWMMTQANNQQPYGALVRRVADVPVPLGNPPDEAEIEAARAALTLYDAENAGLAPNSGDDRIDITAVDGELFIGYCSADGGALTVLDGQALVTRDLTGLGLPGDGTGAALSFDATGRPLFSTVVEGKAVAVSIGPDGSRTPLTLNDQFTRIIECARPPQEDGLLCVLEGSVLARPNNNAWRLIDENQVRQFMGRTLRGVAAFNALGVWLASDDGVVELDLGSGSTAIFNVAGTSGGLPSNDVRVVQASADGTTLYAGTDQGVGIRTNGTWTTLGAEELGNVDVRALAAGPDGTLWIGTGDGLFRRTADGTITAFDTSSGLPLNRINALAVHEGRVFVGTDVGLAVGSGDVFETYGFADGLPGRSVSRIVVTPDGQIWVASDDGIARLL